MAKVIAVCSSQDKGVRKENVKKGTLKEGYGLVGDAHADPNWHRQVSLLALESIEKMRQLGFDVGPGDFAENITCEGIELQSLPLGTQLKVGDEIIRNNQNGKDVIPDAPSFKQPVIYYAYKEVFARWARRT